MKSSPYLFFYLFKSFGRHEDSKVNCRIPRNYNFLILFDGPLSKNPIKSEQHVLSLFLKTKYATEKNKFYGTAFVQFWLID